MNERQTNAMWRLDSALCNYLNGVGDGMPRKWILEARNELSQAYDEAYSSGCFPDKLEDPEYVSLLRNDITKVSSYRPFKT
jgi:hypothetical protein